MKLVVPKIFMTFATLAAIAGTPAAAQYAPAVESFLPPYEVLTIVRSMGFDPVSAPALRGPVYVVRAMDEDAIAVRIAVDARSGRIVRVTDVAGWHAGRFGAYTLPAEPVLRPPVSVGPEAMPQTPRASAPSKAAKAIPLPRPAPPEIRLAARTPLTPNLAAVVKDQNTGSGKSVPAPVATKQAGGDVVADQGAANADSGPDKTEITGSTTPVRQQRPAFPQFRPTEIVPVAPLE